MSIAYRQPFKTYKANYLSLIEIITQGFSTFSFRRMSINLQHYHVALLSHTGGPGKAAWQCPALCQQGFGNMGAAYPLPVPA